MLDKCLVKLIPPPWLKNKCRFINFSKEDTLYKLLLNYTIFFGLDDIPVWKKIPGFFCIRVPSGFYRVDNVPLFYQTKIGDFLQNDGIDILELAFITNKKGSLKFFDSILNRLEGTIEEINNNLYSYKKVPSSNNY
jgi:hypothetical protein